MNQELLEIGRENLYYLQEIIDEYNGAKRKSKKILMFFCVIGSFLVYYFLTDLLGGILGYVAAIAFFGIAVMCANNANIDLQTDDAHLAFLACLRMETLISIAEGTYILGETNHSHLKAGKQRALYKRFIQHYPNQKCKALRRLSNIYIK